MKTRNISIICLIMLSFLAVPILAQTVVDNNVGINGELRPIVSVKKEVLPVGGGLFPGAAIQTIKVSDPFAAAGQPVEMRITIRNDGDKAGFPYDKIPLLPDQYSMLVAVDFTDQMEYLCPAGTSEAGKVVDVNFNWWEASSAAFSMWYQDVGSGYTCKFIDWKDSFISGPGIYSRVGAKCNAGAFTDQCSQLSGDAQKTCAHKLAVDAQAAVKLQPPKIWNCIKPVPQPLFEGLLKDCISKTSTGGTKVDPTCAVQKLGVQSDVQSAEKGFRPVSLIQLKGGRSDWKDGDYSKCVLAPTGRPLGGAVWSCYLPPEGLLPGDEITLKMYLLVPPDTPVGEVREDIIKSRFTESKACAGDINCHAIYVSLVPLKPATTATDINKIAANIFGLYKCQLSEAVGGFLSIFTGGAGGDFKSCALGLAQSSGDPGAIMDRPIAQGIGTFYVVGPSIKFSIQLVLFLSIVLGLGVGAAAGRQSAA